jgi:hypothetical protein
MRHALYPELEQLFTCYLNEDYHYDHPTLDAALRAGVAGLPPEAARVAWEELARLTAQRHDEETLIKILREDLGAHYLWEADGYSTQGWLAHVRELLDRRRAG